MNGKLADALAVFALCALVAVEVDAAYASSITYDEFATIGCGVSDAIHKDVALLPGCPLPRLAVGATLVGLGARESPSSSAARERALVDPLAAWGYAEQVLAVDNADWRLPFAAPGLDSMTVAARLPMIGFALLAAIVAHAWARWRFGPWGGLVALGLVATYPDFLGNGAIVKYDVPLLAFALLAGFGFDRLAREGGVRWLVVTGVALGASVASKLSAPFAILGIVAAVPLLAARPTDPEPASLRHPFGAGTLATRAKWIAAAALVAFVLATLVLWACYLGENPFRAVHRDLFGYSPTLASERQRGLEIAGFSSGFTYFPSTLALKLPLGTLAVLAATIVLFPRTRRTWGEEALLHLPALALFAGTAAFAAPFGSRYLVPAVPFFLVSAGRLARGRVAWLAAAAIASNVVFVALEHPFHATASNPLAGPRELAWRRLNNANVDWGAGLKALGRWQREKRIPVVEVVGFSSEALCIVKDPRPGATGSVVAYSSCPRVTNLYAYGVGGRVALANVLLEPEKGKVYAVSAHVAHASIAFEREAAQALGSEAPRVVLGREVAPVANVGGFLIFDLR